MNKTISTYEYFTTIVLLVVLFTLSKKWDCGGNIDTIWYAAIARNMMESGDFFKYIISKNAPSLNVYDQLPLTYWITTLNFKIFGISDFTSRIYPLICTLFTFIVLFKIGEQIDSKFFGFSSVCIFLCCFHYIKWSGLLKLEIPLILWMLLHLYYFIKAKETNKLYYLYQSFFSLFLGILTKGPVILCIPLAIFIWVLINRDFKYFYSKHFYIATVVLSALILIFYYTNKTIFDGFLEQKSGYLALEKSPIDFLSYFKWIIIFNPLLTLIIIFALYLSFFTPKFKISNYSILFLLICILIIFPFSFFKIKFDHYILPIYPFISLFFAPITSSINSKDNYQKIINTLSFIKYFCIVGICILIIFPIKTSMDRTRFHLNFINIIKFDTNKNNTNFYFLGSFDDDMEVFQNYSFYGSIHLYSIMHSQLNQIDLKNSYLIISTKKLPLKINQKMFFDTDCFLINDFYCLITEKDKIQYKLPTNKLPHEIY